MDRNEKFRQKLYAQSSNKPKRDSLRTSGNFDPNPYVDFIMAQLMEEMEDDKEADPNDFLSEMMENPKFEIIFGKSSALSLAQKTMVVSRLEQRFRIAKDFDPTPYVDKLLDLFGKHELDQFKKYDEAGDFEYDFDDYFKEENFTKEQMNLIQLSFYEKQFKRSKKITKTVIPAFILGILLVFVPPFFIPNLLQKMGLLSVDAGWLLKIGVGILSLIMIFFLVTKLFLIYVDSMFKSKKNIGKDSDV
jgi:hypothetical protein